MKKVMILIFLSAVLVSCASKVRYSGVVENKSMTPEVVEETPSGYRYDCGITWQGKYKCQYGYFFSETKTYPATYTLFVSIDFNKCLIEYPVDEYVYSQYEIGQKIEILLYDHQASCE